MLTTRISMDQDRGGGGKELVDIKRRDQNVKRGRGKKKKEKKKKKGHQAGSKEWGGGGKGKEGTLKY